MPVSTNKAVRSLKRTRRVKVLAAVLAALLPALLLIPAVRFFRTLTGAMAVSNAADRITNTVSAIVEDVMRRYDEEGVSFVSFEKDANGDITAIVTDTARINVLSAELLRAVVQGADSGKLTIRVPLGDLLGNSFTLGRGPMIPVRITLLTSSRVVFKNVLTDAGINQTRHQLILELRVDADVLLPWEIRSTQVVTEVLAAESIIIGRVPDTYVDVGRSGGE